MVFGKKSIEAAQLADMGKFYTGDVVRNSSGCGSDAKYVPGRHEQELGFGIDEARDQPGTGDAVDLRAFTRDPFHSRLPLLEQCSCGLHYEPGGAADSDYRNDAGLVAEQRDYRTESDQQRRPFQVAVQPVGPEYVYCEEHSEVGDYSDHRGGDPSQRRREM